MFDSTHHPLSDKNANTLPVRLLNTINNLFFVGAFTPRAYRKPTFDDLDGAMGEFERRDVA